MVGNLLKDKPFWERCALLLLKNSEVENFFQVFLKNFVSVTLNFTQLCHFCRTGIRKAGRCPWGKGAAPVKRKNVVQEYVKSVPMY